MRNITSKSERAKVYQQMIGQNTLWLSNRTPIKSETDRSKFLINPKSLKELGMFVDLKNEYYGFGATYCLEAEGYGICEVDKYFDIILFFCIEMTNTK